VWRALTDSAELTRWLGYPTQIEPRVGGQFSIDYRPTGGLLAGVVVGGDDATAYRAATANWKHRIAQTLASAASAS
jgi:uncharacterized protein YndB with AHSA1/START domain